MNRTQPGARSGWIPRTLAALAAGLLAAHAPAKIDLVTLPGRDDIELTIYNSQDLTLVRETRTLSFSPGINEIQFSWANTLIDPTSLRIDVAGAPGLEVVDAVFPANTGELIVWNIEAEEETSAPVEIRYFTSGLSWEANYVVVANPAETELTLQQFTRVSNNSGEDFVDASTRVVVGEVNLVELIADLARRGIRVDERELARGVVLGAESRRRGELDMVTSMADGFAAAAPMATGRTEAAEIIKQAVSEYYIFAVEGQETIENGWQKELPNPATTGVPFDLSYEYDPRQYGNRVVKFYKLVNDEDHELGEDPLPQGVYYVQTRDDGDGLRFEGRTNHDYVPIGEDVELNLGTDGLVIYEERQMDLERTNFDWVNGNLRGWDEIRTVELEIRNSRDRAIPFKLTHYITGDWEFVSVSNTDYERVDKETVRWELDLPAQSTTVITYEVTERKGSRVR